MVVTDSGYQAWAAFLDRWQRGQASDPGDLPLLAEDDYPSDVWARLILRITEALTLRLQVWADGLLRAIADARDEFEVARALTQSRRGLAAIRALAGHPGLPKKLSRQLRDAVDEHIRSAQQALRDGTESARRAGVDDRLVQARLRTLHDNPITMSDHPARPFLDGWASDPARPRRRHIIVDPLPEHPEE